MFNGILIDQLTGEKADLSEILDRLSPRDMWNGEFLAHPDSDWFETARTVINSNDYLYFGVAFPDSNVIINQASPDTNGIAPNSQIDGVVSSYVNSLLISMTVTSLQSEGIAIRSFDKKTDWDMAQGEFVEGNLIGEYEGLADTTLPPVDTRLNQVIPGQYFFPVPYLIGGNGELGVSVINLSASYNIAQVFFNFAIPKTSFKKRIK